MSTDVKAAHLTVYFDAGLSADPDQVDQLTRQLLAEIRELEVESVELGRAGATPEGTKSAEAVTLGALAVTVLPTFIPKLMEFLQAWSMRGEGRTIKIKTQAGDRSLELEYFPRMTSQTELKNLVEMLTGALAERKQG